MPDTEFRERLAQLRERHLRTGEQRHPTTGRGIHHVALICNDPDTTIRFYQDMLGFPLVEMFENRDYPGSVHFFFDVGNGNMLAFFDFPGLDLGPAEEGLGGLQHVAISVSPQTFEVLKERLEAAGLTLLGPDRGVEESVYFRDPDGVQVELIRQELGETPESAPHD